MHFAQRAKITVSLISALSFASSCGLLGDVQDDSGIFAIKDQGCLNSLGDQLSDYVQGQANMKKWRSGFQCTLDTLTLFHDFVRGTAADREYNAKDLHTLVSKILIQDKKVPLKLMVDALKLKASVLGGSSEILTRAELLLIINFLKDFRDESIELYPRFREMAKNPNPQSPAKLAEAIGKLATVFTVHLKSQSAQSIDSATLKSILKESSKIVDVTLSDWTVDLAVGLKALLVAGDESSIHPLEWPLLIKRIAELSAPIVAFSWGGFNDILPRAELMKSYLGLMQDWRAALLSMISSHGGAIPFSLLENIIDSVSWDDENAAENDRIKGIYKDVLPTVFAKILNSHSETAIDGSVAETLTQMASDALKGEYHLDRIFSESQNLDPLAVTTQQFITEAQSYKNTVPTNERNDVERLIQLAGNFLPLFNPGERKIVLPMKESNSLHNLRILSAMRVAAMRLVDEYHAVGKPDQIDQATFTAFWDEVKWAAQLHQILDAENLRWPVKRFSEGDLFLPSSNGDKLLDRSEVTYFLLFTLSTGAIRKEMTAKIVPYCSCINGSAQVSDGFGNTIPVTQACDARYTGTRFKDDDQYLDPRKMDWMLPECFQKKHFENVDTFWNRAQVMLNTYLSLNQPAKKELEEALAETGRSEGYKNNPNPVGQTDMEGYAGIMHYVEFLFLRFDNNRNQALDGTEVLNSFPKFKKFLKESDKVPGICANDDGCLEAVFTYIVEHGEDPGVFQLLGWILRRSQWHHLVNANRFDIYRIVNKFAAK